MLEGVLLPSNMAAKTTFCLYLVKRLIVTLGCAESVTTFIFSTIFLKFEWKNFCSERGNSQVLKITFCHMPSYETTHFKKMVRVWKTKSLLFCLRYDPLMVFWRQNHNFHFHKNDVTWPPLAKPCIFVKCHDNHGGMFVSSRVFLRCSDWLIPLRRLSVRLLHG